MDWRPPLQPGFPAAIGSVQAVGIGAFANAARPANSGQQVVPLMPNRKRQWDGPQVQPNPPVGIAGGASGNASGIGAVPKRGLFETQQNPAAQLRPIGSAQFAARPSPASLQQRQQPVPLMDLRPPAPAAAFGTQQQQLSMSNPLGKQSEQEFLSAEQNSQQQDFYAHHDQQFQQKSLQNQQGFLQRQQGFQQKNQSFQQDQQGFQQKHQGFQQDQQGFQQDQQGFWQKHQGFQQRQQGFQQNQQSIGQRQQQFHRDQEHQQQRSVPEQKYQQRQSQKDQYHERQVQSDQYQQIAQQAQNYQHHQIQNKPYQQHYEQQERYAQHRPQQHAQYEQYQQHYEHHDRYPQGNSEHELQEQYDQQYQHYDDQYRQHQTGQQQFQQHHAGQHQFQQQHPGQPRFQQQHAEQQFQQHGLGQQHHVDQQHYQKRPTPQRSFQLSQQQQEHLYQRHQEENKSSVEHSDNQYQNLDQPQEHSQQQSELWSPRQEERQIPYGIQPVPKQQGLPYGIVQLECEKREEPHRGYQNFQQAQVTQQQRNFSNFQPPQQDEWHQSYHQPNKSRQPPQRQGWQSQGRPYQAQGFAGPSRQSQPVPLMQHQISKPDQQPAVQPLMQIQQLQSPSQQQSKPKPLFASAAARSLKEVSQPALEPPVDLLSLLCQPGRQSRPHNLCILLRGLPGAGKSRLARLIKEKEMQQGGQPPRILSIDDYFTMDGRYEYDAEAEPMYRASLLKAFSKQLETGLFPFIIVDCPLETLDQLTPFISAASRCGYSPFALDVSGASPAVCAQRGIHGRSLAEVEAVAQFWQPLPMTTSVGGCGYRRLDASSLLQESDIALVEMDDADASDAEAGDSGKAGNAEVNNEEDAEPDAVAGDGRLFVPSKWESEADRDAQLERLDGLRHQQGAQSQQQKATSARELLTEYMSVPAAGEDSSAAAGRKRVRWADLEELREQAKRKRLGFVACGTDWDKLMSDDSVVADQALNRTKFF